MRAMCRWREGWQSGFILTTVLGIVGAFVATFIGQTIGWYQLHANLWRRRRKLVCSLVGVAQFDGTVRKLLSELQSRL